MTMTQKGFPRDVLVSPGYGAGWSTWSEKGQEVAEYEPIIAYLKNGGETGSSEFDALIEQMKIDLGLDYFYDGGRRELEVRKVDGPYKIDEYGGFESVLLRDDPQEFYE